MARVVDEAVGARHLACGRVVPPRLGNVANGQGPCRECGQDATHEALRLDPEFAVATMRAAGLEPVDPFPGADTPWLCTHVPCGRRVSPIYGNIKRGQGGCVSCAAHAASVRLLMPEEDARAIMAAHGLMPLEPYPGSSRPWSSHPRVRPGCVSHSVERDGRQGNLPLLQQYVQLRGPGDPVPRGGPGRVKIGCANTTGRRLAEHQRYGWRVAWTIDVPSGDDAYLLEQSVIAWWRDELGIPEAYPKEMMPQYGYTETARWDDIHPAFVLEKAAQLLDELDLTGVLHPTRFIETRPAEAASGRGARARARASAPAGQDPLDFDDQGVGEAYAD